MPDFEHIIKYISIFLVLLYCFLLILAGDYGLPLVLGLFIVLFIWMNGNLDGFLYDLATLIAEFISGLF